MILKVSYLYVKFIEVYTIFVCYHSIFYDYLTLLFLLSLSSDYQWQMSEMNVANGDLTKHSQYLEQEQLLMKVTLIYFLNFKKK